MIQPLRTVHRRAFVTLALVLPVVLVVGLSARHRVMPVTVFAKPAPSTLQLLRSSSRMWRTHAIQTNLYADSKSPDNRFVELKPVQKLSEPDLLLYWSATEPSGDSLPTGARLLGAFGAGTTLPLPADAAPGGHLTLYSLAHQSVVDTATLEKLP